MYVKHAQGQVEDFHTGIKNKNDPVLSFKNIQI